MLKFLIVIDTTSPYFIRDLIQVIINNLLDRSEWQILKEKAIQYYQPGNFSTLLGFEYSAGSKHPGGKEETAFGHEDVSHINFYFKDVYQDALFYSASEAYTFNDIFQLMTDECDKGNLNIGFPHYPRMDNGFEINTVNWTVLSDHMINSNARDKVLRGVETYSCWGQAIEKYSDIPITWPYPEKILYDQTDAWVENALWKWSEESKKNTIFSLMTSSDIHHQSRPGSAKPYAYLRLSSFIPEKNPAGLIAVYSVHNTRNEIWDAMESGEMYGSQLLKIRANTRFDGQFAIRRWINCSSPLEINITDQSTFPDLDRCGKNIRPHAYFKQTLNYPISDIWIIKKDTEKDRPWCKIINHTTPNTNTAVVNYAGEEVEVNDFYYIIIKQKGQVLEKNIFKDFISDSYLTFIDLVFINNVENN